MKYVVHIDMTVDTDDYLLDPTKPSDEEVRMLVQDMIIGDADWPDEVSITSVEQLADD